jgi:hypothetical protein
MNTRTITGVLAGLGLTTGLTMSAIAGSAEATSVSAATTAAKSAPVVAFASPNFSGGGVRPDWVFFTTRRHQPAVDTMRVDFPGGRWTTWTSSRANAHAFEEFYNQPLVCNSSQSTDQCGSLTLSAVRRVHDPHHFVNGTRYFSRMQFRNRHGKITRFIYTPQRGWFPLA